MAAAKRGSSPDVAREQRFSALQDRLDQARSARPFGGIEADPRLHPQSMLVDQDHRGARGMEQLRGQANDPGRNAGPARCASTTQVAFMAAICAGSIGDTLDPPRRGRAGDGAGSGPDRPELGRRRSLVMRGPEVTWFLPAPPPVATRSIHANRTPWRVDKESAMRHFECLEPIPPCSIPFTRPRGTEANLFTFAAVYVVGPGAEPYGGLHER